MKLFTKQMLEAALWTFLEVFIVTVGAGWASLATLDWHGLTVLGGSAALAGAAAAVSLIKSILVRNIGTPDSVFISSGEAVG